MLNLLQKIYLPYTHNTIATIVIFVVLVLISIAGAGCISINFFEALKKSKKHIKSMKTIAISTVSFVGLFVIISSVQYAIAVLVNLITLKVLAVILCVATVLAIFLGVGFYLGKYHKKKENTVTEQKTVFVNSALNDNKKDIIGFDSEITSLTAAINKGAGIIGLIADFGSGKSTLVNLFANKSQDAKPIIVNLWSNLTKGNPNDDSTIDEMTLIKSFLFQLASGSIDKTSKKSSYAKSINNRLSKNYGLLSVSTSKRAMIPIVIAIIAFVFSFALKSNSIELYNTWIFAGALIIGFLSALIGIKKSVISFSSWKSEKKAELEINDIFDIYMDIIEELSIGRKGKVIITIEDLDRISSNDCTENFLNLLYRFYNLMSDAQKEQFVFIVAVKPESEMEYKNDDLYRKVFDYTLNLSPIHNEDYAHILLGLLNNENEELLKDAGIKNYKENISSNKDLHFIIHGNNLTIRDIKTRLNDAINLSTTLINKAFALGKENNEISFRTCAAVTYLRCTYPNLYIALLKDEEAFKNIVKKAYTYISNPTSDNDEKFSKDISAIISKLISNKKKAEDVDSFSNDLAVMLLEEIITDNYRMYFYNYPKGSYILSFNEREIINAIQYPEKHKTIDSGTVDSALDENDNKIIEAIQSRAASGYFLPVSIFGNEKLLNLALKYANDATLDSALNWIDWQDRNRSKELLSVMISFKDSPAIQEFVGTIIKSLSTTDGENYVNMRTDIIDTITPYEIQKQGVKLYNLISLFIPEEKAQGSYSLPIISENEIDKFADANTIYELINKDEINDDNYQYICDKVVELEIDNNTIKKFNNIYHAVIKTVSDINKVKCIFEYIKTKKIANNRLFEYVQKRYSKVNISIDEIIKYLNSLRTEEISADFLSTVNALNIDHGLKDEILNKLVDLEFYYSSLCCNCTLIDFENKSIREKIIDDINKIKNKSSTIIAIRKVIISKQLWDKSEYIDLFLSNDYPLVTMEELVNVNDFFGAIGLINFNKITIDNCNLVFEFCNKHYTEGETGIITLFSYLFDEEGYDCITDPEVIENIVYNLDYSVIAVERLSDLEKDQICKILSQSLNLSVVKESVKLMKKFNTLVPILENTLVENGNYEEYFELINSVDNYTNRTIEHIIDINETEIILPEAIREELYKLGYYEMAISSELKTTQSFSIRNEIPFEEYANVYNSCDSVYGSMRYNEQFANGYIAGAYFLTTKKHNRLMSFKEYEQTFLSIQYAFENFNHDEFVEFFTSDWKIKHGLSGDEDASESNMFYDYLKEDDNYKKLNTPELRQKVQMKIWVSQQRGQVTTLFKNWLGKNAEIYPDNGIGD